MVKSGRQNNYRGIPSKVSRDITQALEEQNASLIDKIDMLVEQNKVLSQQNLILMDIIKKSSDNIGRIDIDYLVQNISEMISKKTTNKSSKESIDISSDSDVFINPMSSDVVLDKNFDSLGEAGSVEENASIKKNRLKELLGK